MKLVRENFFLLVIILVAVSLRFINLDTIPIGFNDDEAAFGYNAYSILKTGRDEWGRFLPFPVFESFGDWKLVGYLYLTVISQFVFGISEFATRFPSAVFGIMSVFATYFLAKELFNRNVGLISAFLLAISPWSIIASRNAFESDILIFFIVISTYFFLKGLKNGKYLTFAFIGFAICFYIYRSSWLFIPLFISTLIYLYREKFRRIWPILTKNLIFFVILLTPLIPTVLTFKGQSRFFQESFITGVQRSGIIDEINARRGSCQSRLPVFTCSLIYNKYTFFLSTYLNNYFSNLSPETYFVRGNYTGYQSAPLRGFFYSFELPLLIIGLISLLKVRSDAAKLVLFWILIVPIGPSITGVGNPGRLNILMPAPQIIAAYGTVTVFTLIRSSLLKRLLGVLMTIIILFSLSRFLADVLYYYPKISARYQRYGYKQLFDYLESQKHAYKQIAISRKGDDAKQYIHYLFYEKYDPQNFLNSTVRYRDQGKWQVVEKIGKFSFYPSAPGLETLPANSLLAVEGTEAKELLFPINPVFVVNDPKGDRLFEVYDVDLLRGD